MRLLFALRTSAYLRNFESTLRLLAERGHEVIIALGLTGKPALREADRRLSELAAELPGLTVEPGAERTVSAKEEEELARRLRSWLDYMRYFDEGLEETKRLRARVALLLDERTEAITRAAAGDPEVLRALRVSVAAVESLLPVSESVLRDVERHAPDAVVVSPLMEKGSPQAAYLRAAHRLGIPCGLCVASWDNMTTSSLIHGEPDLVLVWNEMQVEEAVTLHGLPRERVGSVGAPLFDRWFDTRPSTSREDFCARAGLPDARPYILYLGSSPHVAPGEESWVVRWAKGIRDAGYDGVAHASVLVRPHPHNSLDADLDALERLERLPRVAIYPRRSPLVFDADAHHEYFDSIHHAAAVVGVNTTAMIESAIVGRGVHVPLSKRFRGAHQGRPHFDYLMSAGGGLVKTADTIADHAQGLDRAISGEDAAECRERAERFLATFVRPRGLQRPATPFMVDALESLAAQPGDGRGRGASLAEVAQLVRPPAFKRQA